MGCAASRPPAAADAPLSDAELQPHALAQAALATPPFPHAHHLLSGLAKALDLEYGPPSEVGAVSTWMTLELEARPSSHFVDMGTDLQTCLRFVADVEAAVKAKAIEISRLREQWGCPGEALPMRPPVPTGPVALADVVAKGSSPDSWRLRADVADLPKGKVAPPTAPDDGDSLNDEDDDSLNDERELPDDDDNPDGFAGGDGRYR